MIRDIDRVKLEINVAAEKAFIAEQERPKIGNYGMDTLDRYRKIVRELLQSHGANDEPDIECQIICDTENDHYQLVELGWQGLHRIYACYIHLDIKQGKIWIQQNMTEADLGQELVERGVPAADIVLGLQPPYKRPYTQYGVA